jgi:hypothetical protein
MAWILLAGLVLSPGIASIRRIEFCNARIRYHKSQIKNYRIDQSGGGFGITFRDQAGKQVPDLEGRLDLWHQEMGGKYEVNKFAFWRSIPSDRPMPISNEYPP